MVRTLGVEEEFFLASMEEPRLVPASRDVVAAARLIDDGQFEFEFKNEQVELGTDPHSDLASLAEDLRGRRADLAAAAASVGVRLIATGANPMDSPTTTTSSDRFDLITDAFGETARGEPSCGMHVHVSVDSPTEGVAVLDRIRGWLPLLLALSSNSSFIAGRDTGYASFRTMAWSQWPSAGGFDMFESVEVYERARADLVASGAAMDLGMVYFDARLSARYPTIEVRICDVCLYAEDSVTIAGLIRALVATAAAHAAAGEPAPPWRSELMRAARWRAARWGMSGELVDPGVAARSFEDPSTPGSLLRPAWDLVDELLDTLAPALAETGDTERIHTGLARIRARGTGASLQRAAYAEGGPSGLLDAVARHTLAPVD